MLDLELLIRTGPCKRFPAGQQIPLEGDSSEPLMYILVAGKADAFKGTAQTNFAPAGSLLPGDAFGGHEFFNKSDQKIYVANSDCVVFTISKASFEQLAQSSPQVLFEILRAAYTKPGQAAALRAKAMGATKTAGGKGVSETTEAETAAAQAPAVEVLSGGIFPEGHNGYPDITKPEYAKLVFKKEYDCPFCKKKFEDYKVFQSKLFQSKPVRFDLRRYYAGFQTEWFDILTCPHCYYSMFYNYYSEPRTFVKAKMEKELIAAKKTVRLNFEAERDIDFVFTTHYLALVCSPGYLLNYRQLNAKIWGNLSWLYEDVEDEEMARFASAKAAEAYEITYMESHLNPLQEQVACLTIGGMMHRAGSDDLSKIRKFLYNAKTNKMGNKVYSDLAEDLMEALREDSKQGG